MSVTSVRWLGLAAPLFVLLACESATNLDVSYAAPDGGGEAAAAAADADADAGLEAEAAAEQATLEGCPCDPTSGLGCCVTATGAFCTNDFDTCSGSKGEWLRCAKRDPVFESECCWQGSGAGATTRFAAVCEDGQTACLNDADCVGTGQVCKTTTCSGLTFGRCAATPPSCPTP